MIQFALTRLGYAAYVHLIDLKFVKKIRKKIR